MSIKAFDLVPALERLQLMSDKARTQIECIECCGNNLYIGTNDCFVVHYVIKEVQVNGRTSFSSDKQGHKYLGLKKPVVQLKAASALNRILVLCDNTLVLLNMFDLEPIVGGAKVKGVTAFCINENPVQSSPFSVEICVALKKKQLQIYTVTEDRMMLMKDIPTAEPPITMSLNGSYVCVALASQYTVVDYDTGQQQELFPYDPETVKPIVTRITMEEFLLSGPSALGMFATTSGSSMRPPLQWSNNIQDVAYLHPYIIALNDEFLTVHSILDQQQKQSIPFQGGVYMGEFDGRVLVASAKDIYALVSVPVEKQIQSLLADKRVTEALGLAKNARKTGLSKDQFQKMFRRIQLQAGFIEFAEMHFEEARELFKEGDIDIRELLSLYPSLMPPTSDFTRAVPPLHDIADVNQLSRGDQALVLKYKQFIGPYLEEIRGTKAAHGCQMEIDTALLKLYCENNSNNLHQLVTENFAVDVGDCVTWLERYHRYHALAQLYRTHGDVDKAINIWTRLVDGELTDDTFPGIGFLVDFLAKLPNHELVWKYADWMLQKDEELGVKIFTSRAVDEPLSDRMRPDLVVDFLARYPKAVIIYLEFLVFQRKLEKEAYHTHLAVLYLDSVLKLLKDPNKQKIELDKARSKLRKMLQSSNLYRVQLILGKVKETDMHAETAILYGKLGEHDKALRILVHKLRDYQRAERYCLINSEGKEPAFRKKLFQILLSVYLDPSNERRDVLVAPAVALLNNNQNNFDTVKVLHLIPDSWAIGLLSQFLSKSARHSLDHSRTTHIERMLARGENLLMKKQSIAMHRDQVSITDEKLCPVCNRSFSESAFVRYPNGIVTHVHCAKNRHICPITGKLFRTSPVSPTKPKPPNS